MIMKQHHKLIYSNWHNNFSFNNRWSHKSRQIKFKYHRFVYFIYNHEPTHKYKFCVNANENISVYSNVLSHRLMSYNKIVPFGFVLYSNIKKWYITIQFQFNYYTLFTKPNLIWKYISNKQNYILLHYNFNYILLSIINFTKKLYPIRYTTLLTYSINWLNKIYNIFHSVLCIIPITFGSNKQYIQNTYIVNNNLNLSINLKSISQITSLFCISILIYKFYKQNIFTQNIPSLAHITYRSKHFNFNDQMYSFNEQLSCNENIITNTNQSVLRIFTQNWVDKKINFSDLFISKLNLNNQKQLLKYSKNLNHLNYLQIDCHNKNKNNINPLEPICFKKTVFERNIINVNDWMNNLKNNLKKDDLDLHLHKDDLDLHLDKNDLDLHLDKKKLNISVFNSSIIVINNIMISTINVINSIINKLYFIFQQMIDQLENNKYLLLLFFRVEQNTYINHDFQASIIKIYNKLIQLKLHFNIVSINNTNIFHHNNQYNHISYFQQQKINQLIQNILTPNIYDINKWLQYLDLQYYNIANLKLVYQINQLNYKLTQFENIQIKNKYNCNLLTLIDSQLYWFNQTQMIDRMQSILKLLITPKYNLYYNVLDVPNSDIKQVFDKYKFVLNIHPKLNNKFDKTLNQYLFSQINRSKNSSTIIPNVITQLYHKLLLYKANVHLLYNVKQIASKLIVFHKQNHIVHFQNNIYIINQKWNQLWMKVPKTLIKYNEIPLFGKLLLDNSIFQSLHCENNLIWSFASFYSTQNIYESTQIANNSKMDHMQFNQKYYSFLVNHHLRWLYQIQFSFNEIYHFYLYHQTNVLKQYQQWFLTTKWWIFYHNIIEQNTSVIQQYSYDHIYHITNFVLNQLYNWNYKLNYQLYNWNYKLNLWLRILINQSFVQDVKYYLSRLWFPLWLPLWFSLEKEWFHFKKQFIKSTAHHNTIWMNFHNNIKLNGFEWYIISVLMLGCSICIYNVSSFVILNQILLWQKCEDIYDLTYPSWNLQFRILLKKKILSALEKKKKQTTYFSSKMLNLQQKYYYGWIDSSTPRWEEKSLDLSMKQQNVAVRSLLQFNNHYNRLPINEHMNHKSNYEQIFEFKNIWHPYSNYDIDIIFDPLKNMILASSLNCVNLNLLRSRFPINFQPNLHQLIIQIQHNCTNLSTICLDLTDNKSDHILLVSSNQINLTYFQHLIPNYFNIIEISIDKLIVHNKHKPNRSKQKQKPISSAKEYDKEKENDRKTSMRGSLQQVAMILNISKILGNCIIWIPDIHKLGLYSFNPQTKSIGHLVLSILLKYIVKFQKLNILRQIYFVGSTNHIKQLDSRLIYPHKFNSLIYIRPLDMFHRKQMLFTFVTNEKYKLKYKSNQLNEEIGNRTRGYDWNDLIGLANEIALITITQNTSFITTNIFKLAMYKQVYTIINNMIPNNTLKKSYNFPINNLPANVLKHFVVKQQLFYYKIGKAIISSIFINPHFLLFFPVHNMMWKTKFYYLLQTYLEFNMSDNTITIMAIMPIILNCLAGLAARDAWICSTDQLIQSGFALIHEIENDRKLASGLFGGLFSSIYFCDIKYPPLDQDQQIKLINLSKNNSFTNRTSAPMNQYNLKCMNNDNILNINKTILSYNQSDQFMDEKSVDDIQWGYRVKRFPICKTPLFNSSNTIQQYILSPLSYQSKTFVETESINWFKYVPYKRNFIQIQEQQQSQIEIAIHQNKFTHSNNLIGIHINYDNFIEYTFLENSIILMLGKPVLSIDSNLSFQKRNSFWYQDLLITKEILTTLFIKYGYTKSYNKYFHSQISSFKMNLNQNLWTNKFKTVHSRPLVSEKTCFNIFQSMIQISTQMKRAQLCCPIYFYQHLITNTMSHNYNEWFEIYQLNNRITREMFVSHILLESYRYLFLCFIFHFDFIFNN